MNNSKSYWLIFAGLSVMLVLSVGGGVWGAEQSIGHWTGKLFETICHQYPMRSFSFMGAPMAVNSRCFGIFSGIWAGWLAIPFFIQMKVKKDWAKWLLLLAVMLQMIDYMGNHLLWENTNTSRAVLGLLLGVSVSFYLSDFFQPKIKKY